MNLILVISDYGGFNNFLSEVTTDFINVPGNEVHVICKNVKVIDIPNKPISPKIKFHFLDIPRTFNVVKLISASIKIRKLVNIIKPDLVHSHFTTSTFPTILLRKNKIKYWATIHGVGMNSTSGIRRILFSIVETVCFKRLDKIFVLNNQDFEFLRKKYRNVVKYHCLGVGCDINKFDPSKFSLNDKKEIKSQLNIPPSSITITFTGRFVKFKGFDLLIKSFIKLNERYPDKFVLLLIGGIDPVHKIGLTSHEIDYFQNNQNVKNIGFTDEVDKFLAITDIFLFPSKKEGLPTCILEALSMGVPVVTFNSRGNNDIIVNDYNGVLISPINTESGFIEAIVNEINNLSHNKHKRESYCMNALKNRESYSRNYFIKEHLQLYQEFTSA